MGQLTDGGRLAHAVDADHHDHLGPVGSKIEGRRLDRQDRPDFIPQLFSKLLGVLQLLPLDPVGDLPQERLGRLDPQVRCDEDFLQLFQQVGVDGLLTEDQPVYLAGKLFAGPLEPFPQLLEKPPFLAGGLRKWSHGLPGDRQGAILLTPRRALQRSARQPLLPAFCQAERLPGTLPQGDLRTMHRPRIPPKRDLRGRSPRVVFPALRRERPDPPRASPPEHPSSCA